MDSIEGHRSVFNRELFHENIGFQCFCDDCLRCRALLVHGCLPGAFVLETLGFLDRPGSTSTAPNASRGPQATTHGGAHGARRAATTQDAASPARCSNLTLAETDFRPLWVILWGRGSCRSAYVFRLVGEFRGQGLWVAHVAPPEGWPDVSFFTKHHYSHIRALRKQTERGKS